MPAPEVYQMRYFVEASRMRSMSLAAGNLGVSQQALSKGIKSLETALGERLFNRSPEGVELTAFGTYFITRAELVLSAMSLAGSSLDDFNASRSSPSE